MVLILGVLMIHVMTDRYGTYFMWKASQYVRSRAQPKSPWDCARNKKGIPLFQLVRDMDERDRCM